ncbi:hypothetical protein JCM10207_002038 [Rhodosporidiobolus poonsookiae]
MAPSAKNILQKGAACATCKARKVRCDAIKPACTACRRSARFRGEDPDLVCCSYFTGRRCSTGPKRTKEGKPTSDMSSKKRSRDEQDDEEPRASPRPSSPSVLPTPTPLPTASFAPLASTSTSLLPPPPPTYQLPPAPPLQPFALPAPIPRYPNDLPVFLADPAPSTLQNAASSATAVTANLPVYPAYDAKLPPAIDFSTLAYSSPASLFSDGLVFSPDSTSPSSPSSFSFSDASTSSSLLGSPFSLSEDLDLALASAWATPSTPPPPLFLPPQVSAPQPPAFDFSALSTAGCVDCHAFDAAFLPTAHDCDKTLALPLFGDWPPPYRY